MHCKLMYICLHGLDNLLEQFYPIGIVCVTAEVFEFLTCKIQFEKVFSIKQYFELYLQLLKSSNLEDDDMILN